jgi:hypothetical protein
MQTIISS